MMVSTLVCASVFAALAALPSPSSAVAQQQEATSLGEEEGESLADNIMSNVLDGGNDDGEDNNNGAASDSAEFIDQDNFAEQNAGNIGLQGQDQEQGQRAANLDVNVQEDEEPSTSPLPGDGLPPVGELPRENEKIAFQSQRDAPPGTTAQIYIMNADGSGETRLTFNPAFDEAPDWGPAPDTNP